MFALIDIYFKDGNGQEAFIITVRVKSPWYIPTVLDYYARVYGFERSRIRGYEHQDFLDFTNVDFKEKAY